ncbi:hypothetical protein HXX76_003266 [Chlamydomonas incerta]|uniref:Uncharacterized protein n=1 Tax=Chlamydomonas incerta TaxID=51695 RepID=A0A835TE31_CHLIN|nr:hypothetical protein HXX76_003266 [Chlamydomonas incerta]|eukprot:KAG2441648.1 hypothetical protein HXX76_003266 [Chlamydomonas incerta]
MSLLSQSRSIQQRSSLLRGPTPCVKPSTRCIFARSGQSARRNHLKAAAEQEPGVTQSADDISRIEALAKEAYQRAAGVMANSGLTFPPETPAANDSSSYSTSFRVTDTEPTAAAGLSDAIADISAGDPAAAAAGDGASATASSDQAAAPAVGGRYGVTVLALHVGEAGEPDVNAKIDNLEAELAVLREMTGSSGGAAAGPGPVDVPGQPDPALQSVEDLRRGGLSAVEQIVAQGAVMGDFAGQVNPALQDTVEDARPRGLSVTERVVAEGAVMDDPLNNPLDNPNSQPMSGYTNL